MRLSRTLILPAIFLLTTINSWSQSGPRWTKIPGSAIGQQVYAGRQRPAGVQIFRLDEKAFRTSIAGAPSEKSISSSKSALLIPFPNQSGETEQFRVVDAPVIDPALAAKYPGLNSYAGTSVNDPSVHVRFDVTPQGVHAMIYGPGKATVYIDPTGKREDAYYQLVSRSEVEDGSGFKCLTGTTSPGSSPSAAKPGSADDGKLRTYRLALCASLSYSNFYLNGTETNDAQRKAKVLAAQVTQMTRANAIFERDLAVRLVIIGDNDKLLAVTSADNPWPAGADLNETTQEVCDTRIGNSGYDIGHLVNRAAKDGNAGGIGTVCIAGIKGSAYTSYQALADLDFFVVDYLTHEMGHQLGANHTFSFSIESGSIAQVEPGSGSSIMGYAGITSSNVQAHSDDYFHAISIQQITAYIQNGLGSSCAQVTATNNAAPVVNAGANYIIPLSTPFTLTGSATEPDGEPMTYTWEQMTRATSAVGFPTSSTNGPIFRSFKPVTSSSRTFPALESILDGTNTNTWERLPSASRSLVFRLTARDNHAAGGANGYDETTIQFNNQAGPFRVTTGNTAITLEETSSRTITWSVAATNAGAVNCAQVRILLSRDGGLTFPAVLAAATPNDGSQVVTIPAGTTNNARIRIEAVGNIFFDINDVDLVISTPACFAQVTAQPEPVTLCSGTDATFDVSASGQSLSYQWQVSTNNGSTYTNAPGASTSSSYTIPNVQQALNGNRYRVLVEGACPPSVTSDPVLLTVVAPASIAAAGNPQAKQICETSTAAFTVAATGTNVLYQWQVSSNNGLSFTDLTDNAAYSGTATPTLTINNASTILNGNLYRAGVYNATCPTPVYSAAAPLTVNPRPVVTLSAAPLQTLLPGQTTTLTATITPPVAGFNVTWVLNNAVIAGETGTTYLVDSVQTGQYQVRISNPVTGCSNESPVLEIATLPSTRLFVYPNPNTGRFTVSFYNAVQGATRQTITIFNSNGLQIYNDVLPVSGGYTLNTIDLTGFAKGVYYIVIGDQSGKKLKETKVLVN